MAAQTPLYFAYLLRKNETDWANEADPKSRKRKGVQIAIGRKKDEELYLDLTTMDFKKSWNNLKIVKAKILNGLTGLPVHNEQRNPKCFGCEKKHR